MPRVMTLLPRFVAASAASMDGAAAVSTTDDDETAKGMARLFAEVGEAYVGMFATATAEVAANPPITLDVSVTLTLAKVWKAATSKVDPRQQQDWVLMCL